jgi:tRNA A-37 threonylcarbamoyl transferase component Bud32
MQDRLRDALANLLVRLHLSGFFWGDCSLSNTLFRRDAHKLAAYVVDVETGELHETLSDGQRMLDLELAEQNIAASCSTSRRSSATSASAIPSSSRR